VVYTAVADKRVRNIWSNDMSLLSAVLIIIGAFTIAALLDRKLRRIAAGR